MDRSTARPHDSFLARRQKLAETNGLPFIVIGRGPVSPPDPDLDARLDLEPREALDALLDGCDRRGLPVFEKQHARPGDAPRRREWPEPELVGVLA